MPATITHAYFAQDVYEVLPNELHINLNLNKFRMFSQGTDPFMFYNIMNINKGKDIRKLQYIFHTSKTKDYFINLINYIRDNYLYNDSDVKSFLFGFICHYVLDSTLHPFIIYKTGFFKKYDKETYKYNNLHTFMENFIDNDMVKRREKKNPYNFNFNEFCFDLNKFFTALNKSIDYSYYSTYDINNLSEKYFVSLKQMKLFLNLFRKDRFGFKKIVYKTIDTFTSKKAFRLESISYHYPLEDKHNFLNSNNSLWRNPVEYKVTSHDSFIQLYLKSIKIAKNIIINTDLFIKGKKKNLDDTFLNLSYLTGLDCNNKKEIRFFEF